MSRNLMAVSAAALFAGGAALAEVPRVAADIAPVHSLVARVMAGVGAPDLIVQPGATPHEYSLRPSEAAALQDAALVFWIGPDLTPWLKDAIGTLASGADVTELLESEGTQELAFRDDALFEDDDHQAHDDADADDHAHADADDHAHGAHDPHAWLSPANASVWLGVIAERLAAADPANAAAYAANAAAGQGELETLSADVSAILDPVRGGRFIVFHDAYRYFETAFDFPASGAISLGDATDPGPARIAEIRARVGAEGIDCVLSEPQFNQNLVATVLGDTSAGQGVLDPLGSNLEPGPELYPALIRNLAQVLAACL